MKSLIKIFFAVSVILFLSCDESFDPYGDWQDRVAFTCILKSDTTYQTAVLTKGYRPGGYDPYSYTTDPAVMDADLRVLYNDSVYIFRDTTVIRSDTSRYNTPFHYYYNNKFKVSTRKTIEVEVLLSNGKRLRGQSFTPDQINFDDGSEVIVPPVSSNIIQFYWNSHSDGTFFQPVLIFNYKQNIGGTIVEKKRKVPVKYIQQNGSLVPVFPAPSASVSIVYELDAITKVLQEISEGDPDKQNYTILQKLDFDLIAFDQPASRYVSSTSGLSDDLTVTVDVPDYTNIDGGLGVFGSYYKKKYDRLRFLQDYIESFGYNFLQ